MQWREFQQLSVGAAPRGQRSGDPADLLVLGAGRRVAPGSAAGPRRARIAAAVAARTPRRGTQDGARRRAAQALRPAPVRALADQSSDEAVQRAAAARDRAGVGRLVLG